MRDEHTHTRYSRSLVARDSRWSPHKCLNELNADCDDDAHLPRRSHRLVACYPGIQNGTHSPVADDHLVEGCISCASLARLDGFVGQGAYT